jgi:NADPH-dependent 2,4-dienoyl-CoA reductase/sulfur reductase-like enzyme
VLATGNFIAALRPPAYDDPAMISGYDSRAYLTNFDSHRTGNLFTDVLVIGSGVAGARAALEAARFGQVILICKADFDESATRYAQGGIAVATRDDQASIRLILGHRGSWPTKGGGRDIITTARTPKN